MKAKAGLLILLIGMITLMGFSQDNTDLDQNSNVEIAILDDATTTLEGVTEVFNGWVVSDNYDMVTADLVHRPLADIRFTRTSEHIEFLASDLLILERVKQTENSKIDFKEPIKKYNRDPRDGIRQL